MTVKCLIALLSVVLLAGCASSSGKKELTQKELAKKEWNAARSSVLFSLGKQQFDNGALDASRKSLEDAIALSPDDVRIHLLFGRLSIEQGRLEAAERTLQTCRQLDPKNAEANYLSGIVYQRWQKPAEAMGYYEKAAELAPAELAYLLAKAEMALALDRLPAAIAMLQDKLAYHETSATIRHALGQMLMQTGQYAQAADVLRQAIIIEPNELPIREHLALALYHAKEYRQALSAIESLLKDERYASRGDLQAALGRCQLETGNPRDARQTLESATNLCPSNTIVWLDLARAAMELKDYVRGELALRKAMALEPGSSQAHLMYGYMRLRQDRLDDALVAFRKASALDSNDPISLCMSGYVMEKRGQTTDAIDYYARALKISPDDRLATTLMAQATP